MKKPKPSQRYFLPNFPTKSSKPKSLLKKKLAPGPELKVPAKVCKEFNLTKNEMNIETPRMSFKNQNNFCEMKAMIMSPIRLTNLELSLPQLSISSIKAMPRKNAIGLSRRRSNESRVTVTASIEFPVEIITKRCSERFNSAGMVAIRGRLRNAKLSNSKNVTRSLMKHKNNRSQYQQKRESIDRGNTTKSDTVSPTVYSPIYTNQFEV